MITIQDVNAFLFRRYLKMDKGNGDITYVCKAALKNNDIWPRDKSSRWLGYVQALVVAEGLTSVHTEREYTRSLFHEVYKKSSIPKVKGSGSSTAKAVN